MKTFLKLLFGFTLLCLQTAVFAQFKTPAFKTDTSAGFVYQYVENDPMGVRVYTLKNGLKIYLSRYTDEPRIQTYIAVRAGSKQDPAQATGLAHYLEHILFKGTDEIGTSNWEAERVELDKIEALYETYRQTKDPKLRERLYQQIDSVSLVAASYSIANEYDKLMSMIGASGTNAYTWVEQTVYVNEIPSHQLKKWATIEAERFSIVVPRLFHTELEAVYEEKNKGMDTDGRKVWEALLGNLFTQHPYGTQTTIGTIDHLKNPSITEIKKFFNTYYKPNNMAICLSGDLDYDSTMMLLENAFGTWQPAAIPEWKAPQESALSADKVIDVYGPTAESVMMAWRVDRSMQQDPDLRTKLRLLNLILSNGQAGLIDLNLNQKQKITDGYAYDMPLNDYSVFMLGGQPVTGQTPEQCAALLEAELVKLKKGEFPDWLPLAVATDNDKQYQKVLESNKSRADLLVDAFVQGTPWNELLADRQRMYAFANKDSVIKAANSLIGNYKVVVYKRSGTDTTIQKVPKPKISAVPVNRDSESAFLTKVAKMPSPSPTPVFVDFKKEMAVINRNPNMPVLFKRNEENELFTLSYVWAIGQSHDPKWKLAVAYLEYLGTELYAADALKEEYYKIGCAASYSYTSEDIVFTLSGLHKNMDKALSLFESFMHHAVADSAALDLLKTSIIKAREDQKKSKGTILRSAMVNYTKYGTDSPFRFILSAEELKAIQGKELVTMIKNLGQMKHRVWYYGPMRRPELMSRMTSVHKLGTKEIPAPTKTFTEKAITKNQVYWVDYDMVQAEVMIVQSSVVYDSTLYPHYTIFNEYFGGSMGSLVFQEMRESRALAYSVRAWYQPASKQGWNNTHYAYIGTQADKLEEALKGLIELTDKMPQSTSLFQNSVLSVQESIASERVTKASVLAQYDALQRLGLSTDQRAYLWKMLQTGYTYEMMANFHQKYIATKPRVILIVGARDKIPLKKLKQFGKVKELKLEELFGY
jgi:zinc protease